MAKRSRSRKQYNRRRRNTRRNHRGGGYGFVGPESIPGAPGIVSNPQVFTADNGCLAVKPGYELPYSDYAKYTGLPGLAEPAKYPASGGARRSRKSRRNRKDRKNTRRNMKGGRYTFDLSPASVAGVSPNAAPWWAGTYPPVQRIACEGSTPNPLNPAPHTPSTQPLPVASAILGLNPQSGGASPLAPATYGVGDVDSMYHYSPTAGYDNVPSTWKDSVGAPVQLQVPYAAREMNPACLTTGHPPPLTGALYVAKGGGLQGASTAAATSSVQLAKDLAGIPTSVLTGTMNAMKVAGQQMTGTAAGIGSGIGGTLSGSVPSMRGGMNPLDAASSALGSFVRGTANVAAGAVQGVGATTGTLIAGTTGGVTGGLQGITQTVSNLGSGAVTTTGALFQGGKRRQRKHRKTTRRNRRNGGDYANNPMNTVTKLEKDRANVLKSFYATQKKQNKTSGKERAMLQMQLNVLNKQLDSIDEQIERLSGY